MNTSRARVEEYLKRPYSKVLMSDESGGYSAHVAELPGVMAEGDTPGEAIRALDEAMEDWIENLLESGRTIPEPLRAQGFSGKLVLRLPKGTHRQAAERAQAEKVSLNQWIVEAVGERLGAEELAEKLFARLQTTLSIAGGSTASAHSARTRQPRASRVTEAGRGYQATRRPGSGARERRSQNPNR